MKTRPTKRGFKVPVMTTMMLFVVLLTITKNCSKLHRTFITDNFRNARGAVYLAATTQNEASIDIDKDERGRLLVLAHMKKNLNHELLELHRTTKVFKEQRKITLVFSHCNSDLLWAKDYTKHLRHLVVEIVIYSKCQNEVKGLEELHSYFGVKPQVVTLSNVGRNDHSYAHYIANNYRSTSENSRDEGDNIVVFLKDNAYAINEYRPFMQVYTLTKMIGFSCIPIISLPLGPEFVGKQQMTILKREDFGTFAMEGYTSNKGTEYGESEETFQTDNYKNMEDFERKMGFFPLNSQFQPACFGGSFAYRKRNILSQPESAWKNFEKALSRADNIIEGHYAERLWESWLIDISLTPAIDSYTTRYTKGIFNVANFVPGLGIANITFPPGCNWECYLQQNQDVAEILGRSEQIAIQHYSRFGFDESRACKPCA